MIEMPPRRFTDNQEARIVNAYQNGISLQIIATRFKCAVMTVRGILKRHKVKLRQRKLNKNNNCIHPGCPNKQKTKERCAGHYVQYRRTGRTWNIGEYAKKKSMSETITEHFQEEKRLLFERIEERANAQGN